MNIRIVMSVRGLKLSCGVCVVVFVAVLDLVWMRVGCQLRVYLLGMFCEKVRVYVCVCVCGG